MFKLSPLTTRPIPFLYYCAVWGGMIALVYSTKTLLPFKCEKIKFFLILRLHWQHQVISQTQPGKPSIKYNQHGDGPFGVAGMLALTLRRGRAMSLHCNEGWFWCSHRVEWAGAEKYRLAFSLPKNMTKCLLDYMGIQGVFFCLFVLNFLWYNKKHAHKMPQSCFSHCDFVPPGSKPRGRDSGTGLTSALLSDLSFAIHIVFLRSQ